MNFARIFFIAGHLLMQMLKNRADFVRMNNNALRIFQPGGVIQIYHSPTGIQGSRIGFTATKRVGSAVIRNRAKRRLRNIWRELLKDPAMKTKLDIYDIVFIAKTETPTLSYQKLLKSLRHGLIRGLKKLDQKNI